MTAELKSGQLETVANRGLSTASSKVRLVLWEDVLAAVSTRPLLGFGPEGYQTSGCCAPATVQAHNALLQVAVEFGLLGLLAFLWLVRATIVNAMARLWTQKQGGLVVNQAQALIVAMMVSLIAFSMVDGIFYHVVPLLIFSILCALLRAGSDPSDALDEITNPPASEIDAIEK